MNVRKLLILLSCMCLPFFVLAQSDSTVKKVPLLKKQANTTKLEIAYTAYHPGVRINDARPVEVDANANILRKYYTKAPLANEQLSLMSQQRRRGAYQLVIGLVGGGVYALSGVLASANKDKPTPLLVRFGIGGAAMITSGALYMRHSKKAENYMRNSVAIYNAKYYKGAPSDSTAKKDTVINTEAKQYKDTAYYNDMRNDPRNSGMAGIILNLAQLDYGAINSNINGGIGFYYTYKSRVGLTALYRVAYFDNMFGTHHRDKPQSFVSYGIPSRYQRANNLEFQLKTPVISWIIKKDYHLYISRYKDVLKYGKIKGDIMRSLTARAGYQLDNRIGEGNTGMPYETTSTPYPGTGNLNMSWCSAMIRSNIISAGIALSSFRDMKIFVVDTDRKGRREEKIQNDLYADVLYAHSVKFQDIVYWHSHSEIGQMPQRMNLEGTPVKKVGFRVGYQQMQSYRERLGYRTGVELGVTPGPDMGNPDSQWYLRINYGLLIGGRINHSK